MPKIGEITATLRYADIIRVRLRYAAATLAGYAAAMCCRYADTPPLLYVIVVDCRRCHFDAVEMSLPCR